MTIKTTSGGSTIIQANGSDKLGIHPDGTVVGVGDIEAIGSLKSNGNTVGSMAYRNVTISTGDPSGGADGDVWWKV